MAAIRATYNNTILNDDGEPISGAYITVRDPNTITAISETIYEDATGVDTLANPFQTDTFGRFSFYLASPQRVDLLVSAAGYVAYTLADIDVARAGDKGGGAAAGVADGGTIAHGLADTPRIASAQASVANEMVSVTTIDATHITVAIKKHDGTPGTAQTIYWRAYL